MPRCLLAPKTEKAREERESGITESVHAGSDAPSGRLWCLSSPTTHSFPSTVLLERSNVKNYTTETLWGVQLTGELRTRQPPQLLLGSDFRTIVIVVALCTTRFFISQWDMWRVVRSRKTAHCALLQIEAKSFCEKFEYFINFIFLLRVATHILLLSLLLMLYCVTIYTLQRRVLLKTEWKFKVHFICRIK